MNNLPSIPPPDPGFQLMEPMKDGHAAPAAKLRPQKFLYFLLKFWWIPVIGMVLGTATAVIIFSLTPPIFVSSGSLWETEKLRLPDGADFADNRDNYLGTQDDLLRNKRLRDLTLARMAAFNTNQIVTDILQQMAKDDNYLPVGITVLTTPRSSVYTIQARSANPLFTPLYLESLMQTYLDFRKNSRQTVSADTLNSISEQILKLEGDMKTSQDALAAYEQSNDIPVLQQESTVEAEYLAKLKTELSGYQLDMGLLSATEQQADPIHSSGTNTTDTVSDLLHNSDAQVSLASDRLEAEKQIEQLNQKRDQLPKDLSTNAPELVELNKEIAQAQDMIDFYRKQDREQHVAAREALHIKIGNIQQFIKEWEAKLAVDNNRVAVADSLKQNIARNQSMFDRLSSLVENVDIGKNIDQETLAILDHPSPATRSYREAETVLIQGAFLGLGLGLGIILLLTIRDDRFNSIVEVAERFGDSVVGQVPEAILDSGSNLPLLVGNDARHMYAESYRNLRSALLYFGAEGRRPQVILITSAVPNEGKSTIATNLARAMALGGSRVLLVDGDMRKGHIHDLLQLKAKPGLSELLRQPDNLMDFIQATDLRNFSFLARGGIIRDPGDLFLSPAVDQLIGRLREHFDYILIDSGPVFASDDTATLAPKTDGTLFVVRSRFSQARMVREALGILFQRRAQVLGLILNRTDSSDRSYYLYKYGEYETKTETVEVGPGT
jgi:succinoglycan biosynthesis transport protein ExoP